MSESIIIADYNNPAHGDAIVHLLNHYAMDPMGGGEPLSEEVQNTLVKQLAKRSYAFSIIAWVDDKPAGLVNCFEGFSTFSGKPIINIHDLMVHKDCRGRGLSLRLLDAVKQEAESRGAVKLTLEVLKNNTVAASAYRKFGFEPYQLDPRAGAAEFWQKYL